MCHVNVVFSTNEKMKKEKITKMTKNSVLHEAETVSPPPPDQRRPWKRLEKLLDSQTHILAWQRGASANHGSTRNVAQCLAPSVSPFPLPFLCFFPSCPQYAFCPSLLPSVSLFPVPSLSFSASCPLVFLLPSPLAFCLPLLSFSLPTPPYPSSAFLFPSSCRMLQRMSIV